MSTIMIDTKYVTSRREPFFEIAKEYISIDSKVLDIGAGDGAFSKYCKRTDFYLFDGNKSNIDNLIAQYPNSLYGELPMLPFENNFFDLIHCSHVIEHLTSKELYGTLKEINRCLKDGGYIVISTPLLWENFYNDLSHVRPYNPRLLYKYMSEVDNAILTRKRISQSYLVKRLQYRFREMPILESFYNTKNNIIIKVLFLFKRLLHKLGLRKYEKTGYTIVLQKTSTDI